MAKYFPGFPVVYTTVGLYACSLDLVGPLANSLSILISALSELNQTLVFICVVLDRQIWQSNYV